MFVVIEKERYLREIKCKTEWKERPRKVKKKKKKEKRETEFVL